MFSSKKKQQKKTQQVVVDKVIKYISLESKNCVQKSALTLFYRELAWNPLKTWPEFQNRYQKELFRIKKSQTSWNYSDMRILRNSIKKSMQSETLSVIAEKWCESLLISIIEPLHDKSSISNTISKTRITVQEREQILKQQVLTICEFCYGIVFEIYSFFFTKHYLQKSKIHFMENGHQNEKSWSKQEIYLREKEIFEDYIRNILTGLDCFKKIYQLIIDILIRQNQQSFGSFIESQLDITGKPLQIYKISQQSISEFHSQSQLCKKIQKITKILPSIESDNMIYYSTHNKQQQNKKQTITSQILQHILKYFCPEINSSIRYVNLLVCYRRSQREKKIGDTYEIDRLSLNRSESKNFIVLLNQFCILWLDQNIIANSLVVFDAFSSLELYD